jgi:hypothetical protein
VPALSLTSADTNAVKCSCKLSSKKLDRAINKNKQACHLAD